MIFRQLFDSVSGTYTYLLASRRQTATPRGNDFRPPALAEQGEFSIQADLVHAKNLMFCIILS